jgi:hypothetical protein
MNFLAADDMDARMAVQLRKRVGFGITANMHITGMHVEGKVSILHNVFQFSFSQTFFSSLIFKV